MIFKLVPTSDSVYALLYIIWLVSWTLAYVFLSLNSCPMLKLLLHAFFFSHLDPCPPFSMTTTSLGSVDSTTHTKLSPNFFVHAKRHDHISHIFQTTQLPPLPFMTEYKIPLLILKTLSGHAPCTSQTPDQAHCRGMDYPFCVWVAAEFRCLHP